MAADRSMLRSQGQRGETLIEGLIAIVLISLLAIAAYAGLQTAIRSSAQHKQSAVAETLLRSAAERLQDPGSEYLDLAGCDDPAGPGRLPTYTDVDEALFDLPTPGGYAVSVTVSFFNSSWPDVAENDFVECPVGDDPGLQLVELTVDTPGNFTEQLDVLKRSN